MQHTVLGLHSPGESYGDYDTVLLACVCPHQVVNRVLWFHLADFNESLCEGGHYMPHEVVTERDGLSVQHLLLLLLHLRELSILGKRGDNPPLSRCLEHNNIVKRKSACLPTLPLSVP